MAVYRRDNIVDVPRKVLIRNVKRIVFKKLCECLTEVVPDWVMVDHPAHVDRRHVALGREHKGVLVANRAMTKVRIENGVVEGLGDLEIGHPLHQLGIEVAGAGPKGQIFDLVPGNVARHVERLHDRLLINVDTATGDVLHARPLRPLKTSARGQRDIFKLREIGVEPVQDDPGEALLFVHWRPFENGQGSVGGGMLRRNFRMPPIQRP